MSRSTKQKISAKICHLLSSLEFKSRPKDNPFERLPSELILAILASLPYVDQVCFAISCKHIFECFQSHLERRGWKYCKILPQLRERIISESSELGFRAKLLLRLCSKHWKYFDHCFILHQKSVLPKFLLLCQTDQRPCLPDCPFPCALNHYGFIFKSTDFSTCPCRVMTFHRTLKIKPQWKPEAASPKFENTMAEGDTIYLGRAPPM
ncbi:hypothetical protein POX_h09874 [Penicillium oxalicum]|uniref:hypothetical protein n=1 Tax=Penicillium oxalicum TaxID=69781 RepID=UPI0020B8B13A|nr:hypothetical protein POX_h09874 [Penicillium oxalicum]KAI2786107.1 hypothetical protein POX_h09874 [Penicillium oxalicum]